MKPRVEQWWKGKTVGISDLVPLDWQGNTVGTGRKRTPNLRWASKPVPDVASPLKVCAWGTQAGWITLRHACTCKAYDLMHPERMHWDNQPLLACVELAIKLGAAVVVAPGLKAPARFLEAVGRTGCILQTEIEGNGDGTQYNEVDASPGDSGD